MRVLQVVHALPSDTYGGSELYTKRLAEALASRDHEVAIAAPLGDGSEIDLPVEVYRLPATEPHPDREPIGDLGRRARRFHEAGAIDDALALGPAHGLVRPAVEESFADVLASFDPDVVHFQHLKGLSTRLPLVCPDDVFTAWTLHDFWALCEREQLVRADGERCSGPTSVGKCARCHATAIEGADGERYRDPTRWRQSRMAEALAAVDRLVAPSQFLCERFERFLPPEAEIDQRRNGIRVDRFSDTGFEPHEPLTIGYAGRITEVKGLHLLIEAVQRVRGEDRPVELDVWGRFEPGQDPYHARLADEAGDGVTFHGRYEATSTPYEAMDVLALPSVWPENSPLVIQEAFAATVPVLASDIGGMAELVTDGIDGLTFAVGDVGELAARIRELAASPVRVDRLRCGITPPKTMAEHVDELETLYRRSTAEPRPLAPADR